MGMYAFPALLVWLGLTGSGFAQAGRPPNSIFILADDIGYGEVGFRGQQEIFTPNLNQLAAEGLVLTRHYCGTVVCASSRAGLMTGLKLGRAPVRDNEAIGPGGQTPLPTGITTLPPVLRPSGYATGAFSKWGLGGYESTGRPDIQGFDKFLGLTSQWTAQLPVLVQGLEAKMAVNHVPDERFPLAGGDANAVLPQAKAAAKKAAAGK